MHAAMCKGCKVMFKTKRDPAAVTVGCPRCKARLRAVPKRPELAPTRQVPEGDTPPYAADSCPPLSASLVPAPTVPGYTVLGRLGEGGMGVVYRARQDALDREVAIKAIAVDEQSFPSGGARFEQEARAIARLSHPNIVQAYDLTRGDRGLLLIMELLEGVTLEAHLRKVGPLDERTAWGIIAQASAGLEHAARLGIIHRDVKPANLFLVDPPEGELLPLGLPLVKVTDFGLALLVDGPAKAGRLTRTGFAVGTPDYMAPEQSAGAAVDLRADLYALGATAFHMLIGEPPFRTDNLYDLMIRKMSELQKELDAVQDRVSPASRRLLADLMAANPADRLGSYKELRERIQALLAPPAEPAPPAPEPAPPRPRRWRLAIALTCGVAAGLLGAIALGRPRPQAAPRAMASGRGEPLFDGRSLNGWRVAGGTWEATTDAEGGNVLAGQGTIRRPLPPMAYFRVTLGIDLRRARAVQVGLLTGSAAPAVTLELTASEARLRGRPDAAPTAHRVTPPESGYNEVIVERHPDRWVVLVNGAAVGSVEAVQPGDATLQLVTEGGAALFESLEAVELVPK
jgi:eukaryotic-like serine/threonine-protein kinase